METKVAMSICGGSVPELGNLNDCQLKEPVGLEFDGHSIFVTSKFKVMKIEGDSFLPLLARPNIYVVISL